MYFALDIQAVVDYNNKETANDSIMVSCSLTGRTKCSFLKLHVLNALIMTPVPKRQGCLSIIAAQGSRTLKATFARQFPNAGPSTAICFKVLSFRQPPLRT